MYHREHTTESTKLTAKQPDGRGGGGGGKPKEWRKTMIILGAVFSLVNGVLTISSDHYFISESSKSRLQRRTTGRNTGQ